VRLARARRLLRVASLDRSHSLSPRPAHAARDQQAVERLVGGAEIRQATRVVVSGLGFRIEGLLSRLGKGVVVSLLPALARSFSFSSRALPPCAQPPVSQDRLVMRPSRWCVPQLVNPFLDRNVGSVARSMLNFGLKDLVLVDPQCDHLSQDAITLAAGAEDLLRQAVVVSEVRSSLPAAHSPAASRFTAPAPTRYRPTLQKGCAHPHARQSDSADAAPIHAPNPGCQIPSRSSQPLSGASSHQVSAALSLSPLFPLSPSPSLFPLSIPSFFPPLRRTGERSHRARGGCGGRDCTGAQVCPALHLPP
jgi:hypothetical protein